MIPLKDSSNSCPVYIKYKNDNLFLELHKRDIEMKDIEVTNIEITDEEKNTLNNVTKTFCKVGLDRNSIYENRVTFFSKGNPYAI